MDKFLPVFAYMQVMWANCIFKITKPPGAEKRLY